MRLKFRVLLSEQVVALPLRALRTVRELFSISERPRVNVLAKLLLRHSRTTAIYPKKNITQERLGVGKWFKHQNAQKDKRQRPVTAS